jgi:hypothetical protein
MSTAAARTRTEPALGPLPALGRRSVLARLGMVAALLAAALAVRATGVLHPDTPGALPPLPAVATVLPGVIRSGPPTETDLVMLRDTYAVRQVVVVGEPSVEEQAVLPALGLGLYRLDVAPDAAPSPQQLNDLRGLVRSVGGRVVLHDDSGTGPVVVTAAALELAAGVRLDAVLADIGPAATQALRPAQLQALHDIAAAVSGPADPKNPYESLTR